jgi:ATP/maltotriose-dependent transcriptional regulator MalT/DNA-binding SARP family transcriptional activator
MARPVTGRSTLRQEEAARLGATPSTPRAKLVPPEPSATHVARRELEQRLDEAMRHRVTTVVAGPGFGKSTLVAAWAGRVGAAWYTAEQGDRALATFARGLEDALRTRLPGLPGSIALAVAGSVGLGRDESEQAETLAGLLLQEVEYELDGDLALVLDDVQELARGGASARLVAALARQAPLRLHLVLCGRAEPPFRLERLRGRGQVLSFNADLLAFSPGEVEDLLASAGLAEPGLARRVHGLTGGWPAAVRLTVEALRAVPKDDLEDALSRLPRRGGRLFSYLAEEVFARAQPDVRSLLRHVAPLEGFSPALCGWLGVERAGETLARLAQRGLFVQRAAERDDWYTLHALVREFALERWPLPEAELRDLLRRASEWLEGAGRRGEALRALTRSGDGDAVAHFLLGHGDALVAAGAGRDVLLAGEVLPERRDPRIDQVLGEVHALKGAWDEALACYRRAAHGVDPLPARLAWQMGLIHAYRAELEEALESFDRGHDDGSDPATTALLLSWIAMCRWSLGETELARGLAPRALAAAHRSGDDRALAAAHNALMLSHLGRDAPAAQRHGYLGLEAARSAGDVIQEIRIGLNLAGMLEPQEALILTEEALRLAEFAGAELYTAAALLARGSNLYRLGRLDRAAPDLERAASLFERYRSSRVARARANLAFVHELRGALSVARRLYEEALPIAERVRDAQDMMGSLAGIARLVAAEDPETANALATRGVEIARSQRYLLVENLATCGWVSLVTGDRDRAAAIAEEAVGTARAANDRIYLPDALELQALSAPDPVAEIDALEEALALWRAIGNTVGQARAELAVARLTGPPGSLRAERARRRLRKLGVRESAAGAAGLLMALGPDRPAPLAIRTLGGFQVLRKGKPVALAEWQSKKARDALKLLVARRGRPTPRDVLLETLWPEENPARSGPRLSVALSTVRSVLDPAHASRTDHFLASDGEAVRLDLNHVDVDVERFLAGVEEASRLEGADAVEHLEAAEGAYGGDFLEEDAYEEWATPLREEARAAYVATAAALADHASLRGEHAAAARYRLRILERDPYDESAHLGLVVVLSQARSHGEARRAYRRYVARMEEIGVEPAPFPSSDAP